jgi:hypothetical protein
MSLNVGEQKHTAKYSQSSSVWIAIPGTFRLPGRDRQPVAAQTGHADLIIQGEAAGHERFDLGLVQDCLS